MKKATLLCGMLLAITATVASAGQGVNLRWSACFGDGGTINRAFACNTNTGASNVLVGSFEVGAPILQTSGQEVVIDLASAGATLPAWWGFKNTGTCRATGAMSMNFTISTTAAVCADWAAGAASGGVGAYNIGQRGPNTSRIVAAIAVPAPGLIDLFPAQEYFSYNVLINNSKTVGTGACAGCQTGVCIQFNSINITTQIAANNRLISGPTNGTDSDYCTWQGPVAPVVGGTTGCNAAVPTKNATWGAVKSLYR